MIVDNRRNHSRKHIAAVNCIAIVRDCLKRQARAAVPWLAYLAFIFCTESLVTALAAGQQVQPTGVPVRQSSDKPEHRKPSIVNNSSDGPTIHFERCRENDKGHVSCAFVDPDGKEHWVYLAGYQLPPLK
jgi:hypothetical protein